MKAVGYIRVSTSAQAQDGESLKTQKTQIEAHCISKGWELGKVYEDAGISGALAEHRPGFIEMMNDAKSGKFNVIVFTKLSRFARNSRDYQNFQHELEKHRIGIASIKENLDPTSHNGKLVTGIFALLAEWEREIIREQMYENKIAKWHDKRMFNGQTPYGYKWDKEQQKIIENPDESKILNKILRMYVNQGISIKQIVINLNELGIKSRRAKWSSGTLSGIFQNKSYSTCELVANTCVYKGGERTNELKPENEWITFPLPSIVPPRLWNRMVERRHFNIRKQKRTTWQESYWLRDSLKCVHCGGKIIAKMGSKRKDGTWPRYYACFWGTTSKTNLSSSGKNKCDKTHIIADELEQYIWDMLTYSIVGSYKDYRQDKETHQKLEEDAVEKFNILAGGNIDERISETEQALHNTKDQFDKKKKAIDRITQQLEEEDDAPKAIFKKIKDLEQEVSSLNDKIKSLEGNKLDLMEIKRDKNEFIDSIDLLFQVWSDLRDFKPNDRKRLIESLVPNGIDVIPSNKIFSDMAEMNISWNRDIFQYFIEDGKFPSLSQYGSNHSAAHDLSRDY